MEDYGINNIVFGVWTWPLSNDTYFGGEMKTSVYFMTLKKFFTITVVPLYPLTHYPQFTVTPQKLEN